MIDSSTAPIENTPPPMEADVLIVGAGPVGMTLALALAGSPLRVMLVDSQPRGAWSDDPRALAISHGSRQLLERLGAWNADSGTAIREIHVSQRGGFGRTLMKADEYGTAALGYVMRYRDLAAGLDRHIAADCLIDSGTIVTIRPRTEHVEVDLRQADANHRVKARLVVHAEGSPNADPAITFRDYRQHAIVAEVETSPAHGHRAWERFTADGPLALLPLDSGYSLVFTVPPDKARHLLTLDDPGFLAALRDAFGTRVKLLSAGPRTSFPLALRVRHNIVAPRQVWIGNSAQTLHPVSGQGFNLGLRDAWELAETLLATHGADPGDAVRLAAYARGRQLDRRAGMAFTDGIVRLFSNDIPPLRVARGLGLLALDLAPPLRHFVAKRMIWGARAWP